jgi:hypothetical protein
MMISPRPVSEATMANTLLKFKGIMVWVTMTGLLLVAMSVAAMAMLENHIVERLGAHNRQASFLRIAKFLGNVIGQTGGRILPPCRY